MNRSLGACLALTLCAPQFAIAAVFERDWLAPGDGLLTYDNVNRREWLDLSQTRLVQYPGATLEARYQAAILELMPGGQFSGFTVARTDDVVALAESAGIDTTTRDFIANQAATTQLINLLSPAPSPPGSSAIFSVGYLDELVPIPGGHPPRRLAAIFEVLTSPSLNRAGLFVEAGDDYDRVTTTGVMLYRNIPEPMSLLLFVVSIVGLFLIRTEKKRGQNDLIDGRRGVH
jgi:hypothetical protein